MGSFLVCSDVEIIITGMLVCRCPRPGHLLDVPSVLLCFANLGICLCFVSLVEPDLHLLQFIRYGSICLPLFRKLILGVRLQCECRPCCLVLDRIVLELDFPQVQEALNMVIDIHHQVTIMMENSSVREWGFSVFPVLEQCQQVMPPHLAILFESNGTVAARLSGAL